MAEGVRVLCVVKFGDIFKFDRVGISLPIQYRAWPLIFIIQDNQCASAVHVREKVVGKTKR